MHDFAKKTFADAGTRFLSYYLKFPERVAGSAELLSFELPNLERAHKLSLETRDVELLSQFWEHLKDFLMDRGYWQIFVEWGSATLNALPEDAKPTKAWLSADLGWLAMEQSDFAEAQRRFNLGRRIFKSIGHQYGLCALERYLAVLHYRKGEFDKAENQLQSALKIAKREEFIGMITEIKNLQGSLAKKKGDYKQALACYQEAKNKFEELGDQWRVTAVMRNLGRLQYQLKDYNAARATLLHAISLCRELGRKDMLYGCLLLLAETEKEFDDTEQATRLATEAKEGFSELGMIHGIQRANSFLANIEEVRRNLEA